MSTIPEEANVSILNRNEKKARDLIIKLGLKQLPGISRVTFRKKDNQIIAIDRPEVYRSAGGNYVVFGEPKVDNFTQKLAAAQQQAQASGAVPAAGEASKNPEDIQKDMHVAAANPEQPAKELGDDEEVDATGVNPDDIELVAEQANVPKNKATKALKDHNNDIVNAIMSLSK
ncbi:hypothetical protein ZYGR_0AG03530 [Zygosaccharomyces rouxii]|uniref:Nascent polypeptide-associated complex subunit alpha n=1 Tax=Zygosaccharomyces rouxii TaxID=4956 RepID=A0A1Q3A9I3_ZYGRO|nr:hypothetical protein ZYGR_0AG03530 [Zygosaccharomyces rouxii]